MKHINKTVGNSKKVIFKKSINLVRKTLCIMYRFCTNFKRQLKLPGWSYQKKFDFTQTWRYNTKLHDPNKRKIDSAVLSRLDFWMVRRYYAIPSFHFCFLCRINGEKEHLIFRKWHSESYLITAMFKVRSRQYKPP